MAYLTGIGREASGGRIPAGATADDGVVLVCRGTATGLADAARAVNDWLTMRRPARLLGLVVVASRPGTRPRIVRERMDQVGRHLPHVWWVHWVDAYVVATHPDQVEASPPIREITAALEPLMSPAARQRGTGHAA